MTDMSSTNQDRFILQRDSQLLISTNLTQLSTLSSQFKTVQENHTSELKEILNQLIQDYKHCQTSSQIRESVLLETLKSKDEQIITKTQELQNLASIVESKEKSLEDLKTLLKESQDSPNPSKHSETPPSVESETISTLKSHLIHLQSSWKQASDSDLEQNSTKIQDLRGSLTTLTEEQESYTKQNLYLTSQIEALQSKLTNLQETFEKATEAKTQLAQAEHELKSSKTQYSETKERFETLTEKLKTYKLEKETLQSKLEKVYEMLVKENLVTSENQEMQTSQVKILEQLKEELLTEKKESEKLSEQVIQVKMNISKAKDSIVKAHDLDSLLAQTLRNIDMEGSVRKDNEKYWYKDCLLELQLHCEAMVVVKIGAGLMPLADYLKNCSLATQVLQPRNNLNDSRGESMKKELKSPMKNLPSVPIKINRTPTRERTPLGSEKRKAFK